MSVKLKAAGCAAWLARLIARALMMPAIVNLPSANAFAEPVRVMNFVSDFVPVISCFSYFMPLRQSGVIFPPRILPLAGGDWQELPVRVGRLPRRASAADGVVPGGVRTP